MRPTTILGITLMLCAATNVQAQNRADNKHENIVTNMIDNPMLWADVPDPDIIRVGDTFYLVSTTMHLMPGAPIMKSKDLKNWETVGYIFDKLTDSPKYDLSPTEGTVYGRGQWATSLKYHKGKFYALLAPNEPVPWAIPISLQPTRPRALGRLFRACATSTTARCSSTMMIACT